MEARLMQIREQNGLRGRPGPPQIGCIILSNVVFFPEHLWIRQPADWGRQNLRYKGYDLTNGEGLRLWNESSQRAQGLPASASTVTFVTRETPPRFGSPTLVIPRLGQGTFRVAVTDAYGRSCAITGEHSLPVLDAAHIKPFALEGPHEVQNGLLLRSDVHRLFDRGYVTVTPDLHVVVSRRLRDDYRNGRSYYPLDGQLVTVPRRNEERPDARFLEWHNEHIFLA